MISNCTATGKLTKLTFKIAHIVFHAQSCDCSIGMFFSNQQTCVEKAASSLLNADLPIQSKLIRTESLSGFVGEEKLQRY